MTWPKLAVYGYIPIDVEVGEDVVVFGIRNHQGVGHALGLDSQTSVGVRGIKVLRSGTNLGAIQHAK